MKTFDIRFIFDKQDLKIELPVIDFYGKQVDTSIVVIKSKGDAQYIHCDHEIINQILDNPYCDDIEYLHKLIDNNIEIEPKFLKSILDKFNLINIFIDDFFK